MGRELDQRQENANIALTTEWSSREVWDKKHDAISREQLNLNYIKKLEAHVEELKEKVKQLEDDCVAAYVDTFDVGYNDCILVGK